MSAADAKRYRGLAARANYGRLGWPDLQFCAKEACRPMALEKDLVLLKMIAKYMVHAPEAVIEYGYDNLKMRVV